MYGVSLALFRQSLIYFDFLPFVPFSDFGESLSLGFWAGALPKILSQPLTNFFDAPVCTVYPVIFVCPH